MIPGQEGIVTRFAPSPTGRLHLGHAASAIRAHDFALAWGGRFLLRIEDIDGTRSRPEHVADIVADLAWLGLSWEGPVFQSQRLDLYADAFGKLDTMGLVYRCYCTRAAIAASLSAPHGPEAVYPGTCRHRPRDDQPDAPHCWRLNVAKALARTGPLNWWDETAGTVACEAAAQGDVVLARKDAPSSYHLAVTVDDAAQGVTDVVRGIDLFAATHVHRLLQALLGLPTPRYRHHPLLTRSDGERLAKRHGAPTLAALREAGEDGRALADLLRAGRLPTGFSARNA
ncbi:tRNA glutamyl-Q(34) synthetase GluQRS [Sphingomonas sp. Leaf343]|uniref:tRNA glutamyl-Q(34) synthetase GluQRS n=1 Tax=Sphingomonas sp. Leaf343 TaxID=1736345 RepID=UPI000700ACD6|nr:tRNA glutamyl-Q(34) synthetase GluQRS [Sphingomonas sp. Leaf343]KQR83571.1 glutamyl-Q tRNA(Asp) synthetase [Sphingomonas sp. Leaf343]